MSLLTVGLNLDAELKVVEGQHLDSACKYCTVSDSSFAAYYTPTPSLIAFGVFNTGTPFGDYGNTGR